MSSLKGSINSHNFTRHERLPAKPSWRFFIRMLMNVKLKTFLGKLHLQLGLISAPIVFFICLTGTIIVFGDEIIELSAGDARYVKAVRNEKIPVETILEKLKQTYPDRKTPFYMVAYKDAALQYIRQTKRPEHGLCRPIYQRDIKR